MKKLFVLISLFTNTILFAQEEGEIINLFGISDSTGKYSLIYEYVINVWNNPWGKKINCIDAKNEVDSAIFIETGFWEHGPYIQSIEDYDFFNNNPNNIIYAQYLGIGQGDYVFNSTFDIHKTRFYNGCNNLLINHDNPKLIYLTAISPGGYSVSTDSGKTWPIDSDSIYLQTIPFNLLSLYPNTDSTMFGIDSASNLTKTYDAGLTSKIVEESGNWNFLRENLYYDNDGQHIYAVTKKGDHFFIYVSDNYGNKGSWTQLYQGLSKISLSIDKEASGKFVFSYENKIFQSSDFGQTFELINELDYNIVGLFAVPNSDTIYAATRFTIWQIVTDLIIPIKQVIAKESFSFYPLHIGDKWYYDVKYIPGWSTNEYNYTLTKEVIKDTVHSNNKSYLQIKEIRSDTNLVKYNFERVDSLNGKIYKYHEFVNSKEFVLFDLIAESNRPFHTIYEFYDQPTSQLMYLTETGYEIFDQQLKSHRYRVYKANTFNNSYGVSHKLNENIGRSYFEKYFIDSFDEYHYLKAAYINGVKYGDTTLVGVNDNVEYQIPSSFSLSQNYPNPFNPSTTIIYSIPKSNVTLSMPSRQAGAAKNLKDFSSSRSQVNGAPQNDNVNVTLIVYDILGRKIKTLVNQPQNPGKYSVQFNAGNLSSGIYYYQLRIGIYSETKKMILLR